jgi:soluble lytic murein transglycosylase-like protein
MAVFLAASTSPSGSIQPGWIFFPRESIHSAMIVQESRAAGVDPALMMALVAQESGFRPWAVSPSGARGLSQLMPATARWACPDLPGALWDARQNVRCGVRYLSWQLRDFRGNEAAALLAYHDGPTGARMILSGYWPQREVSRKYAPGILIYRAVYSRIY